MYAIRGIILPPEGPMWTDLRETTVALFQEAASNSVVQENAFDLLRFFDYKLRKEQGSFDALHVKDLISDKDIAASLWAAVTATPLSPAATAHINQTLPSFKAAAAEFSWPASWHENLKTTATATEAAKTKAAVKENAGDEKTLEPNGGRPPDAIPPGDDPDSN